MLCLFVNIILKEYSDTVNMGFWIDVNYHHRTWMVTSKRGNTAGKAGNDQCEVDWIVHEQAWQNCNQQNVIKEQQTEKATTMNNKTAWEGVIHLSSDTMNKN